MKASVVYFTHAAFTAGSFTSAQLFKYIVKLYVGNTFPFASNHFPCLYLCSFFDVGDVASVALRFSFYLGTSVCTELGI